MKKKTIKAKKLYAIVDDGNMDGDSAYYCPNSHVKYKKGMTLEDIKIAYRTSKNTCFTEDDGEDLDEEINNVKVAWIVDEKAFKALVKGWPECGGDSITYSTNHSMKVMAEAMAIKTLMA